MGYTPGDLDRSAMFSLQIDDGTGFVDMGLLYEGRINDLLAPAFHYNNQVYPIRPDKGVIPKREKNIYFQINELSNIARWQAMLDGGSLTTTSAGTQAVTDEEVVLTGTNYIALAHFADFLDTQTVTVSSEAGGGGTDYTEGTDYKVGWQTGHIRRISGGSITDGQTVYVDYTYNTYDGQYFEPGDDSTPTEYAVLLTKPLLNGDIWRFRHTKCIFAADIDWTLSPGEEGAWAGVEAMMKVLYDASGAYGPVGRTEIYTP